MLCPIAVSDQLRAPNMLEARILCELGASDRERTFEPKAAKERR